MRLARVLIDRPILAVVLSVFITAMGALAGLTLPVEQYPNIAPPTIQVTATYPGASAEILSQTVATPLEQQINGVENMAYLASQATGDGSVTITVTFRVGTDLDSAQVLTQNRVAVAVPRLPVEVQRSGVTVKKGAPDLLMVVHLISPDETYDRLYMSNYATFRVKDRLTRLAGIGEVLVFGGADYALRVWLDPERIAARGLTAGDVVAALRAQNVQVPAGALDQPPQASPGAFQMNLKALGRLGEPGQFEAIIVRADPGGRLIRLRDIARVEIGSQSYGARGYLDRQAAVPLLIFPQSGSNALSVAASVRETMAELAAQFPPGLSYRIEYDTTPFMAQSIHEVLMAILGAVVVVIAVVVVFLQSWRAAMVPIVAIPVSLVGSLGVIAALGFSLNTLTLFGLVLAVGIVVDDAIVVVESVEGHLARGLDRREAARRSVRDVGPALVAITLVLCAVFIPAAFLSGITGRFFRQFAVAIAASTAISCFVSLTLSPALCSVLLSAAPSGRTRGLGRIGGWFNRGVERAATAYGRLVALTMRWIGPMLCLYAGLVLAAVYQYARAPSGFIPDQDLAYVITVVQLPPAASLERTDAVVREVVAATLAVPGVAHCIAFAGFDGATFTNAPNAGVIFSSLDTFESRAARGLTLARVIEAMNARLSGIGEALVITVPPPPVSGLGMATGFKLMLEDRGSLGVQALSQAAQDLAGAANGTPGLTQVYTLFTADTPAVFADIDRERAEKLGVASSNVFEALQVYVGSLYVNDFTYQGRTFQVLAQADGRFRQGIDDVARLKTRSSSGAMVSLGSLARFRSVADPYRIPRYNLFPAAEVQGAAAPGYASRDAIAAVDRLAAKILPTGIRHEWTDIAFFQQLDGDRTLIVFLAAAGFAFLIIAAQYESLTLPLAVILIVPMCLLAAVTGLLWRTMEIGILAQIGFVVLIGLAAKNAILIVAFARRERDGGATRTEAAMVAARQRFRPIIMTSLAFILGVVPLLTTSGAGFEMCQALGTTVFFGMIGVTAFGLLFTPIFYVLTEQPSRSGARRA